MGQANSPPPWDYIAKFVCIGDSGTGKSSLTIRLCEDRFSNAHDVTIGVEFGSRIVPVGPAPGSSASPPASPKKNETHQKHMKLSLWDTAGQETYKSITRSYFRGASGALLVFDITRRATFEHATAWLSDLRQIAEPDIVVVLVGNKSDLAKDTDNKRAVTVQEAEEWCKREKMMRYVETSAKSGEGVKRAFLEVAERIYGNIEKGRYDLADRRSGVRGPAVETAGPRGVGGSVSLGDAAGRWTAGWGGGCC